MTTNEMTRTGIRQRSNSYTIGWWFLVLISGVSIVNHLWGAVGMYGGGDRLKFVGYAAVNVYALAVLLTSYRRGERWAWWVTWAFVASYAVLPAYESEVGPYYLGAAVLMAISQILTWSEIPRTRR